MPQPDESAKRQLPPYVSFKTMLGFLQKLKDSIVPPQIDADVLRSYPGSTARQLKAALRFLGLTNESDATTPTLSTLVHALDSDKWQPALREIVTTAYSPIIGDLPIDRTTRVQVEGRFREYQPAEKEVLERVVAFYVAALVSAGVKVSPHILERAKPRTNGKPRTRARGSQSDPDRPDDGEPATPSSGTIRFTVPIPDKAPATMLLPHDLTVDDWDMVSTMVSAYIARRAKTGA